jgi:hypothetical protein
MKICDELEIPYESEIYFPTKDNLARIFTTVRIFSPRKRVLDPEKSKFIDFSIKTQLIFVVN